MKINTIANTMNKPVNHLLLILLILFTGTSPVLADSVADSLIPPADVKQSITYWKKYTIDENEPNVIRSREIFSVLLRAWDQSRIEPALYVVESEAGAWAASLADGNILLSRQAIETSFSFGQQRGEHLLAFVLAHELAHQRADDLWHQRFFRMIGSHPAESQKKMMAGLDLNDELLSQLEEKEAQADHDGLVLMASVGFDPYQVVAEKDFFTLWVENIWQQPCAEKQMQNSNVSACKQAQSRALRTQAQLNTVATQSMLYDLGVQSFVAGDYQQARDYFTSYGRDYPGRAIISAIGLTYFAEAQRIHKQLNTIITSDGKPPLFNFYYPMILDAQPAEINETVLLDNKRGDNEKLISNLNKRKKQLLTRSISHFEKAIRLAPEYRQTYILLASAHLLAKNTYRARGVLQGQYQPKFEARFGQDSSLEMLLALTTAIEGNTKKSIETLASLLEKIKEKSTVSPLADNVLRYSAYYNLAELYRSINQQEEAKKVWMDLARQSKEQGNTLLFRLSLNQVTPENRIAKTQQLQQAPTVNGKRLGDNLSDNALPGKQHSDLWIDGERYQVSLVDGAKYIAQDNGKLIGAWQHGISTEINTADKSIANSGLKIGDSADRPFKALGIPDRRLNMTSGEYLAYDDYGLAIRLSNNQVKGWFLYEAR